MQMVYCQFVNVHKSLTYLHCIFRPEIDSASVLEQYINFPTAKQINIL